MLHRYECKLRGDDAGRPVGPFACQSEEIVPKAIGTLTFKEERNTMLKDASKLSRHRHISRLQGSPP
jgi:hypothetical protein